MANPVATLNGNPKRIRKAWAYQSCLVRTGSGFPVPACQRNDAGLYNVIEFGQRMRPLDLGVARRTLKSSQTSTKQVVVVHR